MTDEDIPGLGIHMMRGETLLNMLRRVQRGEEAEDVYMEMFANADHIGLDDLLGGVGE